MPRNIDDIVHAPFNPDVAILIPSSTVTSEVVAGVWLQGGSSLEFYQAVNQTNLHVGLEVTLMILPDGPGNGWPRGLNSEYAVDTVTLELLASGGIKDCRLNTEERHSSGTRLGRNSTWEGSNDDRPGLRLPVRIDDRTLILADMLTVPLPGFWVDRFADRAEDAERGEVVPFDVLWAETTEQANRSRCAVEVGELVLGDSLPVAGWCRVDWSRFEHAMEYYERESARGAEFLTWW
jgi:hypothetical protein